MQSVLPSPCLPPEDAAVDRQVDAFHTPEFGTFEDAKESRDELLAEQGEALGRQFDYDGSVLTPEQRRALFKKYWTLHLKLLGLRSPQYYGDKSQCLSVSETAWPGAVTYLEAEKLRRGHIEPEDLSERLRMLKPSDNFELRKFYYPPMQWDSPTPLEEGGFESSPPDPDWLIDQLQAVARIGRRLRRELTEQYRREIEDRWAVVKSSVELMPLPDSHLLRDMGRSPGGTLLPWHLVKGLMALRDHANEVGRKSYDEGYDSAMIKREEKINYWRISNPNSILADDALSIYSTWPSDLMVELDELDREAIRYGRGKYVAILKETEEKMQTLLAFWRDCKLITGERTSPSSWWQDPKAKVERLPKPQYLKDRLDAIKADFGDSTDEGEKLQMIEMSRWIEAVISGDSEPAVSDTPLPSSLLDKLDIVWRDRCWLDHGDTEDEMIARIRRWRNLKHQQRLEEGVCTPPQLMSDTVLEEPAQMARRPVSSLRDIAMGVMAPEKMLQLREKLSRGACRRPRSNTKNRAIWQSRLRSRPSHIIAKSQTIWLDRLRPRRDAAKRQTGKVKGILKQYGGKASEKGRQAATKVLHSSATQSHFTPSNK